MFSRCVRPVPSEMPSRRAIWRLVCPAATKRKDQAHGAQVPDRQAQQHVVLQPHGPENSAYTAVLCHCRTE
jgi:hypothetical protein